MLLKARHFEFRFPRPVLVMGIVNVTPDSFSDGGKYLRPEKAIARGIELAAEGADVLDIGGESTRPRATPVPEDEELSRVIPVIMALAQSVRVPISIDTMKPAVARAAIQAGACFINDVGANRNDGEMFDVAAKTGAAYVCMHMQGAPATMQNEPRYKNIVKEVHSFFEQRIAALTACRVTAEQIILDPGIGFGKTAAHNYELLSGLQRFSDLGRPLMVGVSRKSFLGTRDGTEPAAKLGGSLACAALAVEAGVGLVRVHDVAETVQAVRVAERILDKRSRCG
jgi:dihydropteroate synthase